LKNSDSYLAFLTEQLSCLGTIAATAAMGGHTVYCADQRARAKGGPPSGTDRLMSRDSYLAFLTEPLSCMGADHRAGKDGRSTVSCDDGQTA